MVLMPQVVQLSTSMVVDRTFFGVHRVVQEGPVRRLVHGTTVHGNQDLTSEESRRVAGTYYHRGQPFGDIVRLRGDAGAVGIIGLGAGGIAAYGRPGQTLVFHEIDPAVADIARNHFTYLADTPAEVKVVIGDGRLTLADVDQRYGLLVLDAFTSDAVPVHLLTVEAIETYLDAIDEDGVIAIHITNRYLALEPVLAASRHELGLSGMIGRGTGDAFEGAAATTWVALARDPGLLEPLRSAGWTDLDGRRVLWTDQRSSLWSVVRR